MKRKIFYLLTILLISTVVGAQQIKTSQTHLLDVFITVTDTFVVTKLGSIQLQQKFDFKGPESIQSGANDVLSLRVNLDYQSKKNTTNYFSISHDGHSIIGASAPVIIPPIKNFNGSSPLISPVNPYPFIPDSTHNFSPFYNSPLHLTLIQYKNIEDYLVDKNRINESTIIVNVNSSTPKPGAMVKETNRDPFTIYPNPIKEYLNIEYNSDIRLNNPIQIHLYDMNGAKVSDVSLTDHHKKNESILYRLIVAHLKPGTYYCHVLQGNKTYFKTLRKE